MHRGIAIISPSGLSSNCQVFWLFRLQKLTNSFSSSRPEAEIPRCLGSITNALFCQMRVCVAVVMVVPADVGGGCAAIIPPAAWGAVRAVRGRIRARIAANIGRNSKLPEVSR